MNRAWICMASALVVGLAGEGLRAQEAPRAVPANGLRLTRWAREPMVKDPVALAFDDQGALFVADKQSSLENLQYDLDAKFIATGQTDRVGQLEAFWRGGHSVSGDFPGVKPLTEDLGAIDARAIATFMKEMPARQAPDERQQAQGVARARLVNDGPSR